MKHIAIASVDLRVKWEPTRTDFNMSSFKWSFSCIISLGIFPTHPARPPPAWITCPWNRGNNARSSVARTSANAPRKTQIRWFQELSDGRSIHLPTNTIHQVSPKINCIHFKSHFTWVIAEDHCCRFTWPHVNCIGRYFISFGLLDFFHSCC